MASSCNISRLRSVRVHRLWSLCACLAKEKHLYLLSCFHQSVTPCSLSSRGGPGPRPSRTGTPLDRAARALSPTPAPDPEHDATTCDDSARNRTAMRIHKSHRPFQHRYRYYDCDHLMRNITHLSRPPGHQSHRLHRHLQPHLCKAHGGRSPATPHVRRLHRLGSSHTRAPQAMGM